MNVNRRHQVKPEQRQVGQIVLREPLSRQVCVKTAQPAKTIRAHTNALQVGKNNAVGVSNDDVLDVSVSIDQYAYLPVELVRCFRELTGEFLSDDLTRRNAPLVELFEAVNLIGLESLKVPFDVANGSFLRYPGGCPNSLAFYTIEAWKGKRGRERKRGFPRPIFSAP
ncbi:MAG: hypothetical protein AABO41_11615 [Acidobacteriota bacterium]